jgi:hypothetical protein
MANRDDVNYSRRLLTMLGSAVPLVYASLVIPRTASAADAKSGPPNRASTSTIPASAETQPPTGLLMHPEYAQVIARMAYVWGWPMVNMLNRNARITKAPHPGLLAGILPRCSTRTGRYASRLHRPRRDFRDLPQSGCGVWSRVLLAR